jgi:beta-1,4-mannosyltransferase
LSTESDSRVSSVALRVGMSPPVPEHERASYLSLLGTSLSELGAKVVSVPSPKPSWALGAREHVDVLHLHWLEFVSPSQRTGRLRHAITLLRNARLCVALLVLRVRGVGVVWTVHNLMPHEPIHPTLERLLARAVLGLANRTIVHSDYAARRVAETLGTTRPLTVVPHGNYIGAFPEDHRSRRCLRKELGLPVDAFVYLAFGQVRPYKRLTAVIDAFCSLPDPSLRLLIAGRPMDERATKTVRGEASRDPRVILMLHHIPDAQVPVLHRAADAAVIGYQEVFSSGAMLLALSYGLPVIAPCRGISSSMSRPGGLETFEPGNLADAMEKAQHGDPAARGRAALEVARRFPWTASARTTLGIYLEASSKRR